MDIRRIDGEIERVEDLETATLRVEVDGAEYVLEPGSLLSLGEIRDAAPAVDPEAVASALGFGVDTFDGSPVYRGRMAGSELYFDVLDAGDDELILVVSVGETQYGRFAYAGEAVLTPSSDT